MEKTYRIGKRFRKMQYLSVAVNCMIVFTFYFIYHYILAPAFPLVVGAPMALGFLLLGAVVARLTLGFTDKYARSVSYTLTDEGLVYRQSKREATYRWETFTDASLEEFRFRGVLPVEFRVDGKVLMLNQYIDGLAELTAGIFRRIAPYAPVDAELVRRAETLKGVY